MNIAEKPSATLAQHEPGAPTQEGFIPLSIPEINGNEWQYVKECLDTGWVSSVGSYVDRFEKMMCEYVNTSHMVATTSGTAALHTAMLVANIQPNEEVLVSTLSFISPANAIRYVGAYPVFMDSDSTFWQMDVKKVERFLTQECHQEKNGLFNKKTGRRIAAIVPVHILGNAVDMDPLIELAKMYDLKIIEDAAEGLGVKYKNRHVGEMGDIGCFSFNGNKIITTGGGGMVGTRNPHIASKAKYITTQAKDDPIEFIHGEIGYNYRLTNVQAAIGVAQLELLESYIQTKRAIAKRYEEGLNSIPGITVMKEAPHTRCTFWMYTILIDEKQFGISSRELLRILGNKKIQARPLWQPLHLSKAHADYEAYECHNAEKLNRQGLSLPCSISLSLKDQERVINEIRGCSL